MSEQDDRLSLPQFREALQQYKNQPSPATFWRWSVGIIPLHRFLIEHPDLIEALASDARTLAEQRAGAAA